MSDSTMTNGSSRTADSNVPVSLLDTDLYKARRLYHLHSDGIDLSLSV